MQESVTVWDDFDHLEVAGMEEPGPLLELLRHQCPVGHSDQHGGFWVVGDYGLAMKSAGMPEIFASSVERGPGAGFPSKYPIKIPMINDDAPLHRDFRLPLQPLFSPRRAEAMAPEIRSICRQLVDQFIETGQADLALEFTMGVPALVVCELLDLPAERRAEFHRWAQDIVANGGDTPSFGAMMAFIDELQSLRISSPGDDIPSQMLEWEIAGRPITRDEWTGMVLLLILAGLDTTSNAGALLFHFLGGRRDLRNYLLEDEERIPAAIEEAIRYLSPVPQHSRGVQCDVDLAGHSIRAGEVVLLHWMSANRDPKEFPDPDKFIPDRAPNRHLGFGAGPHRCLGLHLARVELREMVKEILGRIPDYELVHDGTVRYPGLNRGVSRMRVRFSPGERSAA